jgi:flagellar motor switch protein FliM
MTEANYQTYDFASSARVERPLWLAFHHWLEKFAELFAEQWSNFSSTEITAVPLSIDAEEFEVLQSRMDKPAYGIQVAFHDESTQGMFVIDRCELLLLVMDILGDSSGEANDRALTSIETSLCGLIFEQSASVMGQSWPEQESLNFKIGEPDDQPNRNRSMAPDELLLTSGLSIQIGESKIQLRVMLVKDQACKMLGVDTQAAALNPDNKISPDKIAEVTVQVSAGLGDSELEMSDLVSISVGDIIVLDQAVAEPLIVFANDKPIFRAWPGRAEQQQVVSIQSSFH